MFDVFGLLVLSLLHAGSPPSQATPVVASNPVLLSDDRGRYSVEFVVTNNGSQPVTAWEVRITATYEDGSTAGWGLEREGYGEYEGVTPGTDRYIPPYGSVRGRIPIDSKRAVRIIGLQASSHWAIFADRSWVGSAEGVADVFARRKREHDVLRAVLAALRAGQARPDPREGIAVALTLLEQIEAQGDTAVMHTRGNLQRAASAPDAAQRASLRSVTSYVNGRLEAVARHTDQQSR